MWVVEVLLLLLLRSTYKHNQTHHAKCNMFNVNRMVAQQASKRSSVIGHDAPLVAIGRIPILVAIGRGATLATDGMRTAGLGTTLSPHWVTHKVLLFVVFARHFLFAAHLNLFDFSASFPNLQLA